MPALHNQPYPNFRAGRIAWLEGDIRRQHAQLLAMIAALNDGPDARIPSAWEDIMHRVIEIRIACAELAGLQT